MESVSGILGVNDLKESGTLVEIIEEDGDNTTISRLRRPRCVRLYSVDIFGNRLRKTFIAVCHIQKNVRQCLQEIFVLVVFRAKQYS